MNEIQKDIIKATVVSVACVVLVTAALLPIARHFDRKAEQERLSAPCSEFRDGTGGAMPVRCLPWDVR